MSSRIVRARRVAEALGRQVDESERAVAATFNDLPAAMLAEARKIRSTPGRLDTCDYLSFFVATRREGDAEMFCEDVIGNGQDAAAWGLADLLCGGAGGHELRREGIVWTAAEYRSSFQGLTGKRWFRTRSIIDRDGGIPLSENGPGALLRDTRYWTQLEKSHGAVPVRSGRGPGAADCLRTVISIQ